VLARVAPIIVREHLAVFLGQLRVVAVLHGGSKKHKAPPVGGVLWVEVIFLNSRVGVANITIALLVEAKESSQLHIRIRIWLEIVGDAIVMRIDIDRL
jgi:hypothetical protein